MTTTINEGYQTREGRYTHGGNSCAYIVVHNTGCDGDASAHARSVQNNPGQSSYHYVLDDDEIYHVLDDRDTAWAVGAWSGYRQLIGNGESISIEVCANDCDFTGPEIENLHWLVRKLMADHDIPAGNVVRHYDCHTGRKNCPAAYIDNDSWIWLWGIITSPIGEPVPHQEPGEPVNDSGVLYRSHVQDLGWLDPVRDGQTSGTVGFGLRMEAFKMTLPAGLRIGMAVHMEGTGWKDFGDISGDPVIGTEGESRRIEAIAPYIIENGTGKALRFRVHVQDYGWQGWQGVAETAFSEGSTGQARRIEAVQFVLG